jgi:multidrug transporter EmrE-like cation transporter
VTPLAITLILLSALTHAGWNLLGKRMQVSEVSFLIASVAGALFLLPFSIALALPIGRFPPVVWGMLVVAGGCETLYYCALAVLRDLPGHPFTPLSASLAYLQINTLTNGAGLLLAAPLLRDRRSPSLTAAVRPSMAALMGVVIYLSYGLVLLAMAYVTNVAYVAAFRQVSIPIGAALGMTLLREPRDPPRIAGLALITVGPILTALGR